MIGMVHAQSVLEDGDGEVEYKTSIARLRFTKLLSTSAKAQLSYRCSSEQESMKKFIPCHTDMQSLIP